MTLPTAKAGSRRSRPQMFTQPLLHSWPCSLHREGAKLLTAQVAGTHCLGIQDFHAEAFTPKAFVSLFSEILKILKYGN